MIKEFIGNLSEYENTTNEYIKKYKTFDEFLNLISREIVIFGASTLGIFLLEYLKSKNVNVKFFSDNDKNKQGNLIEGIPVKPPSKINIKDVVLIASGGGEYEIYKQLVEMGIRDVIPYGKFQFKSNVENIEWLYQNLEDGESKENVFASYLAHALSGQYPLEEVLPGPRDGKHHVFDWITDPDVFFILSAVGPYSIEDNGSIKRPVSVMKKIRSTGERMEWNQTFCQAGPELYHFLEKP